MSFYVIKYSGEKELFKPEKFRRSLKKAGASERQIDQLLKELETASELRSTHDIYEFALAKLHASQPSVAARYNIKHALFELGPTGFPFEKFIGELFKKLGYKTETGQIVQGSCVEHEIDVVGHKNNQHSMIECKFHNQQGLRCDVKVPLYVQARFEDISTHRNHKKLSRTFHEVWLVTNTKFTSQAIQYGNCASINLLGWSYPVDNNLESLIDRFGMHPITALTSLSQQQKKNLMQEGFVLCQDAARHQKTLTKLGFSQEAVQRIVREAEATCTLQ